MPTCTVPSSSSNSAEETFKGTSGTICSPNYPQHYYNNEYKQYKIIAPSLSKIVLTFSDFEIEYDYACSYDWLKVSTVTFTAVSPIIWFDCVIKCLRVHFSDPHSAISLVCMYLSDMNTFAFRAMNYTPHNTIKHGLDIQLESN